MDILMHKNMMYMDVKIVDYKTTIDLGLHSESERRALAKVFIEAAERLLEGLKDESEGDMSDQRICPKGADVPTPETDAVLEDGFERRHFTEFARSLERRLAGAVRELAEAQRYVKIYGNEAKEAIQAHEKVMNELAELKGRLT